MFTRKPRLQLEKFAINGAKRLLQHNLPIGDIDPRYSINSLASVSKLGGNAIPSAFAVLEIDNNLKSHVQQRPPGVIFRLEVLGLLLAS